MPKKISEIDIGVPVKNWFISNGWECWSEVKHHRKIVDLVTIRHPLTAICECKTTLNISLLEQADHWIRSCQGHLVYIAVPYASGRDFILKVCKSYGIGVLSVYLKSPDHRVKETVHPKLWRKAKPKWDLHQEQKLSVPGTFGGGHWTPWKQSIESIRSYLMKNGTLKISEIVKAVPHHWKRDSTAVMCITKQIDSGIIKGIVRIGDKISIA